MGSHDRSSKASGAASESGSPARVGTAGWAVASRYASDFPTRGTQLERYARRLNAAEINTSFHRPHRRETYERWADAVPKTFRFAVKLPKAITHGRRLGECAALLGTFLSEAEGLGEKLGAFLVQLPPSLVLDRAVAEGFFDDLGARSAAPIVCEPRHASWFTPEADAMLRARRVARVAADPARVAGADEPGGWDGCCYWRLHGSPRMYYSDYRPECLAETRLWIASARARGAATWCIFDNTAASAALGNALAVSEPFLAADPDQVYPPKA